MKNEELEKVSACTLNRIFGYEPAISSRIISTLGSASAIFTLTQEELRSLSGPYIKGIALINDQEQEKSARELERLESAGYTFLPCTSPHFPELLLQCYDHPAGLYVRSSSRPEEIFSGRPFISIVGTRDISPYGREWCTRIVAALSRSEEKPVIVSGLAIGVDITAHLAALGHSLPTIAVLPTGIDEVYPSRHCVSAGKISSSGGCALITDYPPGTSPKAFTFLRRNRIIAGMSRATILIESKARGGGMLTARLASGYGREVFVLPGRIDDSRSEGCNILIAEKIAEPIVSTGNLPKALGLGSFNRSGPEAVKDRISVLYPSEPRERMEGMKKVIDIIFRKRGITPEEICSLSGMEYKEISVLLGMLENDGFIETDLLQRCTINCKNL